MSASAAFTAHAGEYDATRRRLVPDFDGFYGAAVEVVADRRPPARRVLDLGAGTGLLSSQLLRSLPELELELLDGSEAMLAQARQRLEHRVSAFHVADLADPLPDGPFDAVVSALAIHHLADDDKRALVTRVARALTPGGVFVNAEQVAAPDRELEAAYEQRWLADCRALGASEEEIAAAQDRMRHDRCTTVAAQLDWLRRAGLGADCVYKRWGFAVLAAWRPRS